MKNQKFRVTFIMLVVTVLTIIYYPSNSSGEILRKSFIEINNIKTSIRVPEPLSINGVTYFPLNELYTKLGCFINEKVKGKEILLSSFNSEIIASVNSSVIIVNGKKVDINKPIIYRAPYYYVPSSFQQYTKIGVVWNKKVNIVNITNSQIDEFDIHAIDFYSGAIDQKIKNRKIQETLDKSKKILSSILTPKMSEIEKEYAIYDYVIKNIKYDDSRYIAPDSNSFNAYGAIVLNKAFDKGISEGVEFLFKMAGIECCVVNSETIKTKEKHSWNAIRVNGHYYYLDASCEISFCNLPEPEDIAIRDGLVNYLYFNMTTKELENYDHKSDRTMLPFKDNRFKFLREYIFENFDKESGRYESDEMIRDEKWIYAKNASDKKRLYKISIDGSNETRLTEDAVAARSFWACDNGLLFLTDKSYETEGGFYVVPGDLMYIPNDNSNVLLIKKDVYYAEVIKDKVCYEVFNTETHKPNVFINNVAGGNEIFISDSSEFNGKCIFSPYILCTEFDDVDGLKSLFTYNITNGQKRVIYANTGSRLYWVGIHNNSCYLSEGARIIAVPINGSETSVVMDETSNGVTSLGYPHIDGNTIYFQIEKNGMSINYKYSLTTKKKELIEY